MQIEAVPMSLFRWSKTEQKIYDTLCDGRVHKFEELYEHLTNGDCSRDAVSAHVGRMRKKLRPRGLDIVCVFRNRKTQYQMIRPLYSSE
jgi:DNA-binding response OmpR family regulator